MKHTRYLIFKEKYLQGGGGGRRELASVQTGTYTFALVAMGTRGRYRTKSATENVFLSSIGIKSVGRLLKDLFVSVSDLLVQPLYRKRLSP